MTYHPTTRVLPVLELLQTYHQLSAADIALRLEIDQRTVRRYIAMLQELGIPVAATRGRGGGYRLRPGYKLPPLIFSESEALSILLGLLIATQAAPGGNSAGAMAALAKISRVLPAQLRQRWSALQETLVLHPPLTTVEPPPTETLASLAVAIQDERPVWLRYRSSNDETTERLVEPYGIVFVLGVWYLAGYCRLRSDFRTFRVTRILRTEVRPGHCPRPDGFDPLGFVRQTLTMMPAKWSVEVFLGMPLAAAQQEAFTSLSVLEPVPDGVVLRCTANDLRWIAHHLLALDCPWEVRQPQELLDTLQDLATECLANVAQARVARERYDEDEFPGVPTLKTANIPSANCGLPLDDSVKEQDAI